MFLIPYRTDVPIYRWPIANFVLLGLLLVGFFLDATGIVSEDTIERFILEGWNPLGLFGHMFLHIGILHLVGNGVFLWVFGNAICEKVGSLAYPLIFLGLGLGAAAVHILSGGGKAVGASGAINGLVGMYLVWFPLNDISCVYLYWIIVPRYGSFDVSGYWMILFWLFWDMVGLALGLGRVAYAAHLGGFLAGIGLASALTLLNRVEHDERTERTLLDILKLRGGANAPPQRAATPLRPLAARIEPPREPMLSAPLPPVEGPAEPIPFEPPALIKFRCACGAVVQTARANSGKLGRCASCRKVFRIPCA